MKTKIVFTVFLCSACAFLIFSGGCLDSNNTLSGKQQYLLDINRIGASPSSNGRVVKIRRFRVSSRFEGVGLVYRTGEVSYESDFYNEFLTSPASIITEEVRQWLDAGALFANVLDSGSTAAATLMLEGNVSELYGDYTDKNNPKAVLEIGFFLIDLGSAKSSIVFHKTYEVTTPLDSNRPTALITGWNSCLEEILETFEKDLKDAFGSNP